MAKTIAYTIAYCSNVKPISDHKYVPSHRATTTSLRKKCIT